VDGDGDGGAALARALAGSDAALRVADLPAVPPPPAASRARPPRLIYPTRSRDVLDGAGFLARLTIDRDGFVVAAQLLRGDRGGGDDRASAALWRFRYDPALDDDGHPVSATIEQPFLVE
jgi:hypothetical protein